MTHLHCIIKLFLKFHWWKFFKIVLIEDLGHLAPKTNPFARHFIDKDFSDYLFRAFIEDDTSDDVTAITFSVKPNTLICGVQGV